MGGVGPWRWRRGLQMEEGKEGDEGKCDSLLGDVKLDWRCCSSELDDVNVYVSNEAIESRSKIKY